MLLFGNKLLMMKWTLLKQIKQYLTDLPPSCKSINCKWVFRKKLKNVGSIEKYKARLVIIGRKHIEDVDFFDTNSPKVTTIRVLIALACIYNLEIHEMDVKTVFLNGNLEEEIYMNQQEGFIDLENERKFVNLLNPYIFI